MGTGGDGPLQIAWSELSFIEKEQERYAELRASTERELENCKQRGAALENVIQYTSIHKPQLSWSGCTEAQHLTAFCHIKRAVVHTDSKCSLFLVICWNKCLLEHIKATRLQPLLLCSLSMICLYLYIFLNGFTSCSIVQRSLFYRCALLHFIIRNKSYILLRFYTVSQCVKSSRRSICRNRVPKLCLPSIQFLRKNYKTSTASLFHQLAPKISDYQTGWRHLIPTLYMAEVYEQARIKFQFDS